MTTQTQISTEEIDAIIATHSADRMREWFEANRDRTILMRDAIRLFEAFKVAKR